MEQENEYHRVMKKGGFLKRRTPMKKRGKRVLAWESTRRKLKIAFERAGITSCELRVCAECTDAYNLSFAHAEKRRFITTQAQLEEACLACIPCHDVIEAFSHEKIKSIVRLAISERETPVVLK